MWQQVCCGAIRLLLFGHSWRADKSMNNIQNCTCIQENEKYLTDLRLKPALQNLDN